MATLDSVTQQRYSLPVRMYNKLFTKILDSSIWLEPTSTRIVWVTFLAVMDEHGFAQFATVGNVANRARVTLEEAQTAVATLEAPDKASSDKDHKGRRLERVPGGWIVLNAEKHRQLVTRALIQEQTRERVRRHRELKRSGNAPVTPSGSGSGSEKEGTEQPRAAFAASYGRKPRKTTATPAPTWPEWTCPHDPACLAQHPCYIKTALEEARAKRQEEG